METPNESDLELSFRATQKRDLFKKPRKLIQQIISVASDETLTDSDLEKSVPSKITLFKKKSNPSNDMFNVSFNETNVNVTENDTLVSSATAHGGSKGLINKSNPFKKKALQNISKKKQLIDVFAEKSTIKNLEKSEKNLSLEKSSDTDDWDLTKYIVKVNPFQKKIESHQKQLMEVSAMEEKEKTLGNIGVEKSLDLDDAEQTHLIQKINPFRKSNLHEKIQISFMEGDSSMKNFSIDKSADEGNVKVKDLFRRSNKSKEKEKSLGNIGVEESLDLDDLEQTHLIQKINPFRKSNLHEKIQISFMEGDSSMKNFSVDKSTDEGNSKVKSLFRKSNKSKESFNEVEMQESDVGNILVDFNNDVDENSDYYNSNDDCNESTGDAQENEMEVLMGRQSGNSLKMEKAEKSLPIEKGLQEQSNLSSISELHFNQSSFNDENLNVEYTDHSDEDMPPPMTIPPVRSSSATEKHPQDQVESSSTNPSSRVSWEEKFKEIVSKSQKGSQTQIKKKPEPGKIQAKQNEKEKKVDEYKPRRLKKPASFATRRLYKHIINKLEPKYGIDTLVEAERIVLIICDTVKTVNRRKNYQKKLIQDLKKELASVGLIETTIDFYEFVIGFLPYPFRVKVVPCLQTRTNTVFPPKDVGNPFDKIL